MGLSATHERHASVAPQRSGGANARALALAGGKAFFMRQLAVLGKPVLHSVRKGRKLAFARITLPLAESEPVSRRARTC